MKKVLVTGAAGLIGSAVTCKLLEKKVQVIACDNFSIGTWKEELSGIIWENVDIASEDAIKKLSRHDIDAVIHCAAHPGGKSLIEPNESVRVNCTGSMQLFDWCAKTGIPVIYLSSSIVYGPGGHTDKLICEDVPLEPATIYAACKVACENFLQVLQESKGLKWVILRLFSTYGAGHQPGMHQGIVNIMLTQLLKGDKVVVKGSLERVRDLVYVYDAAEAVVDSLFCEEAIGQVINVGTGVQTTIKDMIYALCDELGLDKGKVDISEEASTPGDPFFNVADISKLRKVVGFKPTYDLKAGISELVKERKGIK